MQDLVRRRQNFLPYTLLYHIWICPFCFQQNHFPHHFIVYLKQVFLQNSTGSISSSSFVDLFYLCLHTYTYTVHIFCLIEQITCVCDSFILFSKCTIINFSFSIQFNYGGYKGKDQNIDYVTVLISMYTLCICLSISLGSLFLWPFLWPLFLCL